MSVLRTEEETSWFTLGHLESCLTSPHSSALHPSTPPHKGTLAVSQKQDVFCPSLHMSHLQGIPRATVPHRHLLGHSGVACLRTGHSLVIVGTPSGRRLVGGHVCCLCSEENSL